MRKPQSAYTEPTNTAPAGPLAPPPAPECPPVDATLEQVLVMMRAVTERVYWLMFSSGVGSHCHAMIEFCGVISAYVSMCEDAARDGTDFRMQNRHSGQPLPMPVHRARYISEKLDCIFGDALRADPECARAWRSALGL